MTIDERIESIKESIAIFDDCFIRSDESYVKEWEQEVEWLEELKWWRSQDLINRNDIPEYCKMDCEKVHCETCGKTFSFCNEIMQIPKAEYRGGK